jgi:Fe-Mn family superoxide dismutase
MAIKLIDLPYAHDALAPAISADTLATHHGKHHKAYVDKTNEAVEGTPLDGQPLEQLVAAARRDRDAKLFNNAAQAWNHGFYWHSLTPSPQPCPTELGRAVEAAFGSQEALVKRLVERGVGHFASGWVWLAADRSGVLSIEETHDGDTLADSDKRPLLTIDVWEHAYYLDYQNRRPEHLEAVTGRVLNWAFAAENLARQETWRYPG